MAITISKETAEKLYDLYQNVTAADAHYLRCQSDNFRLHVSSVSQNAGVAAAFAELRQQIDEARKENDGSTAPQKGRRGVLG